MHRIEFCQCCRSRIDLISKSDLFTHGSSIAHEPKCIRPNGGTTPTFVATRLCQGRRREGRASAAQDPLASVAPSLTCMRTSVRSAGVPTYAPMNPAASPQTAFSAIGSGRPSCADAERQSLSERKMPIRAVVYVACRSSPALRPLYSARTPPPADTSARAAPSIELPRPAAPSPASCCATCGGQSPRGRRQFGRQANHSRLAWYTGMPWYAVATHAPLDRAAPASAPTRARAHASLKTTQNTRVWESQALWRSARATRHAARAAGAAGCSPAPQCTAVLARRPLGGVHRPQQAGQTAARRTLIVSRGCTMTVAPQPASPPSTKGLSARSAAPGGDTGGAGRMAPARPAR